MAMDCIRTNQVFIDNTGAEIISALPKYQNGMTLHVKNIGSHIVYIGRMGITPACGYPLKKDEEVVFRNFSCVDSLYGICDEDYEAVIVWMATINR